MGPKSERTSRDNTVISVANENSENYLLSLHDVLSAEIQIYSGVVFSVILTVESDFLTFAKVAFKMKMERRRRRPKNDP